MKNENNLLDFIDKLRKVHDELRTELLDEYVTIKQNKHHVRIPAYKRFEVQKELEPNIDIIMQDQFKEEILDYNEYYLSIETNRTQIIDKRVKEILNKHGLDFGTMIIITAPPFHNPELTNTLLIKIVEIEK